MKLQFDANQKFQTDAVKSVTDIFEGQPLEDSIMGFNLKEEGSLNLINGAGNNLVLSEDQILNNLQVIQANNDIPVSEKLDGMNFTVEMETGTGKTYVYLRTIYELHKAYMFRKFVIVVPSVAIREGVLKNLNITHEHFQNLYDNIPVNFQLYDSSKVSTLRGFATGNNIEILVINIDSFAKDENIINRNNDKLTGQKPIDFIRATNPVVIVDEPQNMETDKRKKAIENLNPLCTIRYSATHKNLYNPVYRLDPVKAYDLGLVKQIEVDSVIAEKNNNNAFVQLKSVKATKTKTGATIIIDVNTASGVQKKSVSIAVGDDLYVKSNEREIYKDGYIVEEIDVANETIQLSNGTIVSVGTSVGGFTDEIMKFQIRKSIEEHLKKEKNLLPKGIKVLSLFFIDRVSNYRSYDQSGTPVQGKFALWFEEIYKELISMPSYLALDRHSIDQIHNGYFSQDNKGKFKDTSGETKDDDSTYNLIMKDKEKLLDIENPLRFIFSHSALREGWDNPNVFQICTLNETSSEIKKRQEIGRGLRLAVDNTGQRIFDQKINRLTVIANEAYEDFAKALQKEIEEDCGVSFEGRIKDKNKKEIIKYRKGFQTDPKFVEIWEKIKYRTTYRVEYSSDKLTEECVDAVKSLPVVKGPVIHSIKKQVTMDKNGVGGNLISENSVSIENPAFPVPDVLGYIQDKTSLSRTTICDILEKSDRIGDILKNPQLFMDMCIKTINSKLSELVVDGIKYEKIGSNNYDMMLLEEKDFETYLDDNFYKVVDSSKTIHENYIPLDSSVESQFAKDCETSEQIELYFKLPTWFKIPTPIGNYNPDWAVVFKNEKKIYFVAETKSTTDLSKLRPDEAMKIRCGEKLYSSIEDVEFKLVTSVRELQ